MENISDRIKKIINNFSKKHDGLIPRFEIIKWNGESEEWIIRITNDAWILEEVVGTSLENALQMIENEI